MFHAWRLFGNQDLAYSGQALSLDYLVLSLLSSGLNGADIIIRDDFGNLRGLVSERLNEIHVILLDERKFYAYDKGMVYEPVNGLEVPKLLREVTVNA